MFDARAAQWDAAKSLPEKASNLGKKGKRQSCW
jgi:hypothetical protein